MPDITFHRPVFSLKDFPVYGLPEICISGRSNVGKSSMINCLANKHNLARISQKPGKTRSLNYYLVDNTFFLVDLPGYGYARIPKSQKMLFKKLVSPYLDSRSELIGLIQIIDSRHGPVSGDKLMIDWLREWDGNVLYVFTKADKLSASRRAQFKKKYEEEFGMENIVMFSASTGTGKKTIWSWIYSILQLKGNK